MAKTSIPASNGVESAPEPAVSVDRSDAPETAEASSPRRRYSPWMGSAGAAALVFAAYVAYAGTQWSQFTVRSWDLGIFTQLLARYASFQAPIVHIKGDGYNLLGDHFHPLLALLAPVYALFPSPFTLLVIQSACFAIAAFVLAQAAQRRLGAPTGVALGLALGFGWGLQYAADAQFHEIALAVPLLTLSLVAIVEGRWRAGCLWAAPLVFVKEDLGLTVVAIGFVVAVLARSHPRPGGRRFGRRLLGPLSSGSRDGLWLCVWGIGWFLVATLVVLPALNPDGAWAYADKADPSAVFADAANLFNPAKGDTLLLILAVTAGLVLRSPIALVLLPTLAWRFASTNSGYWGPTWHYSAVLMPIALVALLDALGRVPSSPTAWVRAYGRHGAAIAVTAAVMLLPGLPLHVLAQPAGWAPSTRAASADAAIAAVPTGATVVSDIGLMNFLVADHDVYWIGNANPAPDCLVIDTLAGGTPKEWGSVVDVGQRLYPGNAYTTRFDRDGYQLACR